MALLRKRAKAPIQPSASTKLVLRGPVPKRRAIKTQNTRCAIQPETTLESTSTRTSQISRTPVGLHRSLGCGARHDELVDSLIREWAAPKTF